MLPEIVIGCILQELDEYVKYIILTMMMMIFPNPRARKEGKESGDGEGGVWKNFREKEENADGATQSATYCTMWKRG